MFFSCGFENLNVSDITWTLSTLVLFCLLTFYYTGNFPRTLYKLFSIILDCEKIRPGLLLRLEYQEIHNKLNLFHIFIKFRLFENRLSTNLQQYLRILNFLQWEEIYRAPVASFGQVLFLIGSGQFWTCAIFFFFVF